jgi:hypothetical protein
MGDLKHRTVARLLVPRPGRSLAGQTRSDNRRGLSPDLGQRSPKQGIAEEIERSRTRPAEGDSQRIPARACFDPASAGALHPSACPQARPIEQRGRLRSPQPAQRATAAEALGRRPRSSGALRVADSETATRERGGGAAPEEGGEGTDAGPRRGPRRPCSAQAPPR